MNDLADLDPEVADYIWILHTLGYTSRQIATLLVIAGFPAPHSTTTDRKELQCPASMN